MKAGQSALKSVSDPVHEIGLSGAIVKPVNNVVVQPGWYMWKKEDP